MIGNPQLGPGCPVCDSDRWGFNDMNKFSQHTGNQPKHSVTVRATCDDCDSIFDMDLELYDQSMFRELNIQSVGPPIGCGWGEERLHVWGEMADGFGSEYCEQYLLNKTTIIDDNS